MLCKSLRFLLLIAVGVFASSVAPVVFAVPRNDLATVTRSKLLTASEAATFLPGTVFFRGQSAPIQSRNSGGVQFAKDALFLVTLVDTAGYSSSVQEKYQAYLITETPINMQGHRLEPGAYGCGFVSGGTFVVMDIGGHDLFSAHSSKDPSLRRPTPLQVLAAPSGTAYRLYVGRDYVEFTQSIPVTSTTSLVHP